MTFLAIILITIIIWLLFSPQIKSWLRRRAERHVADFLRSRMGMPTEKEQRKAARQAERSQRREGRKGFWSRPAGGNRASTQQAPDELIPREYAVDVEYTEIKTFSQTVIAGDNESSASVGKGGKGVIVESQVSDVEYTEIKISDGK